MSVHFITGKPGGGKSLYGVKLILEELVYGTRHVYTNVALDVGRLNEYLQKEYPNKDCNVVERVRILTDEETAEFWTYRPSLRIPRLNQQQWSAGSKPSYAGIVDHGVFYAIDEVHNFFNARAWAETGRDVLFYLSQHRKLGDTVICITQAAMNVDKQFRSVTQDFTSVRNLAKERHGFFTLPGLFLRRTYGSVPTETTPMLEMGTFRLDVSGVASCYKTAVGVGIHDRVAADKREKRKGVPWYVLAIGLPLIVWLACWGIPKLIVAYFKQKPISAHASSGDTNSPASAGGWHPLAGLLHDPPSDTNQLLRSNSQAMIRAPVEMTGFVVLPVPTVFLSDGRTLKAGDPRLALIADDYCIVDGKTNWMVRGHSSSADYVSPFVQPPVEVDSDGSGMRVQPGPSSLIIIGQREQPQRYAPNLSMPGVRAQTQY